MTAGLFLGGPNFVTPTIPVFWEGSTAAGSTTKNLTNDDLGLIWVPNGGGPITPSFWVDLEASRPLRLIAASGFQNLEPWALSQTWRIRVWRESAPYLDIRFSEMDITTESGSKTHLAFDYLTLSNFTGYLKPNASALELYDLNAPNAAADERITILYFDTEPTFGPSVIHPKKYFDEVYNKWAVLCFNEHVTAISGVVVAYAHIRLAHDSSDVPMFGFTEIYNGYRINSLSPTGYADDIGSFPPFRGLETGLFENIPLHASYLLPETIRGRMVQIQPIGINPFARLYIADAWEFCGVTSLEPDFVDPTVVTENPICGAEFADIKRGYRETKITFETDREEEAQAVFDTIRAVGTRRAVFVYDGVEDSALRLRYNALMRFVAWKAPTPKSPTEWTVKMDLREVR